MCRHYKLVLIKTGKQQNLSLYKKQIPWLSQEVIVGILHYLYLFGLTKPNRLSNTYIKFLLL